MTKRTGGAMEDLVRIVSAADGEIVGRTRLQKAAFLLELAGLGSGYEFKSLLQNSPRLMILSLKKG